MSSIAIPRTTMTTPMTIVSWVCRIAAALILLQTLFFKFTGAPESVYIFAQSRGRAMGTNRFRSH